MVSEATQLPVWSLAIAFAVLAPSAHAQKANAPSKPKPAIPHGQDHLPGPALSPAEAIQKMVVPDGFSVELVAAEPDIVNPVAMTFDERGRIWITESLEYPRKSAGPGKDRIKILESTKGDGVYDKITIFAEGLNIPSGIAVGYGGVWVANSPDILFYRIGPDGKAAAKPEVVVTGFGRADTHELPNSLTWGPDGWLYGLNGVFNPAHIKQNGHEFRFTCAMFRINPRTREFQVFCEGTSNPWGIAWDSNGSAFVSACVIDHLWHLVETGYYHRQGGPYPPFTWKIDSIVRHKHQKAAYCGLHYFDSDAYPPEYRDKLYMGNIHGNCINCDELTRDGSTYLAKPRPDFLTANDAWFMPVSQKTGPDGCLYILDWYDRYHCYQDAQRDPLGIDRLRGRLYRVRFKNSPRAGLFDLGRESDAELIKRLHSPNVYFRDIAQRLLAERNHAETRPLLEKLVLDTREPRKARMHALWSLIGSGSLTQAFDLQLVLDLDPVYRAWGVRAAGNVGHAESWLRDQIRVLASDGSPDVRLQVAIASRKIEGIDPIRVLTTVLRWSGDDKLIPHIMWQNLQPLLEDHASEFLASLSKQGLRPAPILAQFMPRVVERLLARLHPDAMQVGTLVQLLTQDKNIGPEPAHQCLILLTSKLQAGEIEGSEGEALRGHLQRIARRLLETQPDNSLGRDAILLAATLGDAEGLRAARQSFEDRKRPEADRLRALEALIAGHDAGIVDAVSDALGDKSNKPAFRGPMLAALGRLDQPRVADIVLTVYPSLEKDLQPRAIELLTQRTPWSKKLLDAIERQQISASALNVNHVRKLLAARDADIAKKVASLWGSIREGRNPEREKVVKDMRLFLAKQRGNATAGAIVFKNVCAQCHKIYGEGQDVGPDLTSNGRNDYDQLLSNVFDPSLVIGAGYQATVVATKNGRVIIGIVTEDNAQRVVLKQQGGKLEIIPRGEIDDIKASNVSLMPEGLEKQLKPQEIADLFAFLTLDKPPSDPTAGKVPGAPK